MGRHPGKTPLGHSWERDIAGGDREGKELPGKRRGLRALTHREGVPAVCAMLSLPLRSPPWLESCRALSGQFQRSQANWNLHSSMPLCAPAATLLE